MMMMLRLQLVLGVIMSSFLVGKYECTPLDDDLRALQEFLRQTSGRNATFVFSGSSSSAHPCSLLNNSDISSSKMQVLCSTDGTNKLRITGLLLESMELRGEFPTQTLGKLSALRRCSLFNNSLTGNLPPELWSLSQLNYLSLSRNLFSGQIPPEISHLSELVRLDLSYNQISGTLPSQLGELHKLRYLFLRFNSISSPLPAENLVSITTLLSVDLSSNNFSGTFPSQIFSLPNIHDLDLSNNHLSGPFPTLNNTQMPPLYTLDLSRNHISGPLSSLQGMTSLTRLDLSDNLFIGDVSSFVGGLPASLSYLDLSFNRLSGSPSWNLSHLASLTHLGLAGNEFTPGSCQWVDGFSKLVYLNLAQAHITGVIPQGIGNLTNLTELDLSHNELDGTLPASFANLRKLTRLDLSSNNLTGDVSILANLTSLLYLNMSYNDGTGCVTANLRNKFGPDAFKGTCDPFAAAVTVQDQGGHSRRSTIRLAILFGALAASIVAVCLCMLAVGLLCKRKVRLVAKKIPYEENYLSGPFSFETDSGMWLANVKNPNSVPVVMFEKPLLNLTFADLLQATSNFSKESQLTEGGFGPVYRANLPSGLDVTIKVLIEGRILADHEASAEFAQLSKIKHPNLVPLLGYCVVGDERLVIHEYMENGGLHRWLHDLPVGTHSDDWSRDLRGPETQVPASGELGIWATRHRIALGLARVLAFLHHGHSTQIVHRDVKASNVMLDAEFEPHLANTGLVGLLAASDEGIFAGSTPGYAPPEYRQSGSKVSARGDVYSYGVVLLELVTGKKPVGDNYQENYTGNMVGWIRFLMKEKRGHRALDPRIADMSPISEMLEALRIGYLCTAESPAKRPTMQQIVGLLKDLEPRGSSP